MVIGSIFVVSVCDMGLIVLLLAWVTHHLHLGFMGIVRMGLLPVGGKLSLDQAAPGIGVSHDQN